MYVCVYVCVYVLHYNAHCIYCVYYGSAKTDPLDCTGLRYVCMCVNLCVSMCKCMHMYTHYYYI